MVNQTIAHPGSLNDMLRSIDQAKADAKMKVLERDNERLLIYAESLFTAIRRGDQVDLTYPDGEVITITRARPKKPAGGEEASS